METMQADSLANSTAMARLIPHLAPVISTNLPRGSASMTPIAIVGDWRVAETAQKRTQRSC